MPGAGHRQTFFHRARSMNAKLAVPEPLQSTTARMQVLMLSDVYFPRINGVSTSIRTSARSLVHAGHAVTLVAPDYGDPVQRKHDTEFGEHFRVLRVPSRRIFFDPEDRLMRWDALKGLMPEMAARPWDAVHVHTPFRAHQLGVRLRAASGHAVVETYHTYFEAYIGHYVPWLPRIASEAFARRMSRKLCNAVDHLVVPTTEMQAVLARYGVRTASTVLPTGLDLDEFSAGDGEAFRARHGIARERPVLLTVSRLAREKQIDFLLRVASELVPRIPQLLLVIAGEGPDAPRLKALAQQLGLGPNVLFLGNLDRGSALLDCYRAADLFVFASPTETQGLVLIEAMALGVPIVSTAVMGTATVLRGARSARIAPEDVPAFADCVDELLKHPERRIAMAVAGPVDARAWGVDAMLERLLGVYASRGMEDRRASAARA
jgi:1,2-diacylglycerol 3-alpha-glucosyltransferase